MIERLTRFILIVQLLSLVLKSGLSSRTSADDGFPVVITELTFPSVTVESVPFTIHTGTSWAVVYKHQRCFLEGAIRIHLHNKANFQWAISGLLFAFVPK